MPKRTRLIPISKVREGQEFRHYGNLYRRATAKEAERHPSQELAAQTDRALVFAYGIERGRKTPLSFVTTETSGEDLKVVVAADGGSL